MLRNSKYVIELRVIHWNIYRFYKFFVSILQMTQRVYLFHTRFKQHIFITGEYHFCEQVLRVAFR